MLNYHALEVNILGVRLACHCTAETLAALLPHSGRSPCMHLTLLNFPTAIFDSNILQHNSILNPPNGNILFVLLRKNCKHPTFLWPDSGPNILLLEDHKNIWCIITIYIPSYLLTQSVRMAERFAEVVVIDVWLCDVTAGVIDCSGDWLQCLCSKDMQHHSATHSSINRQLNVGSVDQYWRIGVYLKMNKFKKPIRQTTT